MKTEKHKPGEEPQQLEVIAVICYSNEQSKKWVLEASITTEGAMQSSIGGGNQWCYVAVNPMISKITLPGKRCPFVQ